VRAPNLERSAPTRASRSPGQARDRLPGPTPRDSAQGIHAGRADAVGRSVSRQTFDLHCTSLLRGANCLSFPARCMGRNEVQPQHRTRATNRSGRPTSVDLPSLPPDRALPTILEGSTFTRRCRRSLGNNSNIWAREPLMDTAQRRRACRGRGRGMRLPLRAEPRVLSREGLEMPWRMAGSQALIVPRGSS
jgi:hypothetical protein